MLFKTCSLLIFLFIGLSETYAQGYSLRFMGNGINGPDADRVKIRIDDPNLANDVGPGVDVGATDFTIEFWLKGDAADNSSAAITCGANYDWIYGNIIFDRDRFNQGRAFGISIAGGNVVFGVLNEAINSYTLCGSSHVLDGNWHHVAVQRRISDGWLWLFVDGNLEAQVDGPNGDISYPDDGIPGNHCNGPCNLSDPFIVLGAEKHDAGAAFPSFNGNMDELRFSDVLRYTGNFTPANNPFQTDANTLALYHFDEGMGNTLTDLVDPSSNNGLINVGGNPAGPLWSMESPFANPLFVEVVNFQAKRRGLSVYLSWKIEADESAAFMLKRSLNSNGLYTEIARFGYDPVNLELVQMEFIDKEAAIGLDVYYQLYSKDLEGIWEYKAGLRVEAQSAREELWAFPSQFSQELNVYVSTEHPVEVSLIGLDGRSYWGKKLQGGKLYKIREFTALPPGIYLLKVPNYPVKKLIKR